jgi:hypothetical protein
VDARLAAKGEAALRHLAAAAPARTPFANGPSAGLGAPGAHTRSS